MVCESAVADCWVACRASLATPFHGHLDRIYSYPGDTQQLPEKPSLSTNAHRLVHRKLTYSRRVEKLSEALDALIPQSATVLDVGCGDGLVSYKVSRLSPGRTLTGIEILHRENCMIPCQPYDGESIPYPDGSFDYVMFVDVLHHTTAAGDLLLEACRVARRGVIIKDHYCESRFDYYTLAFMDWFGNAQHGVAIPCLYKARAQWKALFAQAGLQPARELLDLQLYPTPFDAVFGRNLHFAALLEKTRAI